MKNLYNKLVVIFCLVILASIALVIAQPTSVLAVSGSQWQPGYIIDDSLFFNSNLIGANDIQTFLSAKVPTCDTNGTQSYAGTTRAAYGTSRGYPPPFICLKDYTETIPTVAADSYCIGAVGGGTKSAAQIIKDVGAACSINPSVLIVLLEKEQNLVTDDWPWSIQYRSATGYGCPDTAACDTQYYGFFNQVYNAARQFQRYVKQPQSFNYRAGQTSFISYQANAPSCGGTNVYLQNGATAALYNYTPYQPNQPALNNLYGTGDGCSAYGNRNFWRIYNDWFGPTQGSLVKTAYDNTVYLLNGTTAHPINSLEVLNDFSALGPVRTTSAAEINTYSTGSVLGRMIGDSNGTLYLINSNIKLPFTSCASVADYGFSCGQVTYMSSLLLNKFANGPPVTSLLRSNTNSSVYYINGGIKRPIPSMGDMLGFKVPLNILTDSIVNQLPTGLAAYSPGSLVKTVNSNTVYMVRDINNLMAVSNFIYPQEFGMYLGVRTINSAYTVLPPTENKIKCNGVDYIVTNGGAYSVSNNFITHYGFNQNQFIDVSGVCQNILITNKSLDRYLRVNNGTIYYIDSGQKRAFTSYSAYQSAGGTASNTVDASDFFASTIPSGPNL